MSMHFPCQHLNVPSAVVSLGGRWSRPKPIIRVTVIGPSDSRLQEALLDTGADDTVFPERLAAILGADLSTAPAGTISSVAGTVVPVRYAQVTLRITDGVESREWLAWIAFTPARLRYPLLGFAGFLQFFTAIFHGDRETVDLEVNGFYPGR